MDNLIKYFSNIEASMKARTICMICVSVAAVCVSAYVVSQSYAFSRAQSSQIYILDEGKSIVGLRSSGQATIEQEVVDHVRTFHSLFFNLAPSAEAIEANKKRALFLADQSAASYWNDLQEDGYFNRMISVNAAQQIIIDSVSVNTNVYPYQVKTFAKVMVIRSSVMTLSSFESTCGVYKTERSLNNPHGLMIERFFVDRFKEEARRPR